MAKKDPCVLVYFDKWISSTNGMNADFRSWYFDLLIYQYDKKGIPNDLDFIAGICRVRPSEYDRFKQMLEQVLKQKFSKCEDGLLRNNAMQEVLEKRETFKAKRELSGTIGQIMKIAKSIKGFKDKYLEQLKEDLFGLDIEQVRKHMDKQVLEQTLKLYIDVNEDVNVNKDIIKKEEEKTEIEIDGIRISSDLQKVWDLWKRNKKGKYKNKESEKIGLLKFVELCNGDPVTGFKIVERSIANTWAGLFELPKDYKSQDLVCKTDIQTNEIKKAKEQILGNIKNFTNGSKLPELEIAGVSN